MIVHITSHPVRCTRSLVKNHNPKQTSQVSLPFCRSLSGEQIALLWLIPEQILSLPKRLTHKKKPARPRMITKLERKEGEGGRRSEKRKVTRLNRRVNKTRSRSQLEMVQQEKINIFSSVARDRGCSLKREREKLIYIN